MTGFTDTLRKIALDEHIANSSFTEEEADTLRENNGFTTSTGEQELNALDASAEKAEHQKERMKTIERRLSLEAKVANSELTEDEVEDLFERAGVK